MGGIYQVKWFTKRTQIARGKGQIREISGDQFVCVDDFYKADGIQIQQLMITQKIEIRNPVENLLKNFAGTVCGDKGYISVELFQKLFAREIKLVTGFKKGMENKFLRVNDKIPLRKRSLIESVIGLLKCNFSLEHSRHRSVANFCCHIVAALLAYQLSENKPHIHWECASANPWFVF